MFRIDGGGLASFGQASGRSSFGRGGFVPVSGERGLNPRDLNLFARKQVCVRVI